MLGEAKSEKDCAKVKEANDILTCNHLWPVCVFDSFYKSKHCSHFCFRLGITPRIINDYFTPEYMRTNTQSTGAVYDGYDDDAGSWEQ